MQDGAVPFLGGGAGYIVGHATDGRFKVPPRARQRAFDRLANLIVE